MIEFKLTGIATQISGRKGDILHFVADETGWCHGYGVIHDGYPLFVHITDPFILKKGQAVSWNIKRHTITVAKPGE